MTTSVDAKSIASQIISTATNQAGATWASIQKAAPSYIRGYAQNLADIAVGVEKGEITASDARMYAENAQLLLVMGIANTSQIVLSQVQALIDNVLNILKTSINAALPVKLL